MKRKLPRYVLLFLVLSICSIWGYVLYTRSIPIPQNTPTPVAETEEIIVPALIDASTDMTRVPTIQGGIVRELHVSVGQVVKKGDPLFSLDNTIGEHTVLVSKIALQQAKTSLLVQTKNLKHAKAQLQRLKSIDKRALNQAELREKTHELKMATLQLKQLQHTFDAAAANLKNAELALKLYTIVAPKDGIVLQINAHIDEFINGGSQVIILGDAQKVVVRISIDERDVKKFSTKTSVYLSSAYHENINVPLTFIQLDRYIIMNDRLNARVQEALYYFNRKEYPDFVAGEQADAHITIKKT